VLSRRSFAARNRASRAQFCSADTHTLEFVKVVFARGVDALCLINTMI
jgi:hypothetical protein